MLKFKLTFLAVLVSLTQCKVRDASESISDDDVLSQSVQSQQKIVFSSEFGDMKNDCKSLSSAKLEIKGTPESQIEAWGALGAWLSKISYLDTKEEIIAALKNVSFRSVVSLDFDDHAMYGFAAQSENLNVIFFRGTKLSHDWIRNIKLSTIPGNFIGLNGFVHFGFNKIIMQTYEEMWDAVSKLNFDKNVPLLVTGHSLGGAIATLVSAKLKKEQKANPILLTFGQPRVGDRVLNKQISDLLKGRYYRFFRSVDPVSRIPPPPESTEMFPNQFMLTPNVVKLLHYAHSGIPVEISGEGNIASLTDWKEEWDLKFWEKVPKTKIMKLFEYLKTSAPDSHAIGKYSCQLFTAANRTKK